MSSLNSKQSRGSDLRHYKFSSEGSNSSKEAEEEVQVLPNKNREERPAGARPNSDKNVHGFGFLENSLKGGSKPVEELEAAINRLKTENEVLKSKLASFKVFLNMVIHDLKHPLDAL